LRGLDARSQDATVRDGESAVGAVVGAHIQVEHAILAVAQVYDARKVGQGTAIAITAAATAATGNKNHCRRTRKAQYGSHAQNCVAL
jgi:hypothetical protein